MTIQYDASVAGWSTSGSDAAWSHTVTGTGDSRILMVFRAGSVNSTTAGITYGGDALTQSVETGNSASIRVEMWHLVGPLTGANTVQVSGAGGQADIWHSISFTGVDQSNPFGTIASSAAAINNSGPATVGADITGAANWGVATMGANGNFNTNPGATAPNNASITEVQNSAYWDGANNSMRMALGYGQFSGASFDATWTIGGTGRDQWGSIAVPLRPASAFVSRSIHYFYDIYDPLGKILDASGQEVPPWELRANKWIRVSGLFLPSSTKYDNFTQDPELAYIEEVSFSSRGGLKIKTNRGELTEVLLARAAGGKTL